MKTAPTTNNRPTEMLFAVILSELADFVRHSAFHLDFTNPSIKNIAGQHSIAEEADRLIALEKTLEEMYLAFCTSESPLHFMTICTMRGHLAKCRFLQETGAQRNVAVSHALRILECDTNLMTSPLTKGYIWFLHVHFPFPAYIHLLQDLKERPVGAHADQAWEVMSKNYEVRIQGAKQTDRLFFTIFSRIVFQAWEARENQARRRDRPLVLPRIVSNIRNKAIQMTANFSSDGNTNQHGGCLDASLDDVSTMPTQMDFIAPCMAYGTRGQ
jgi:hypothetical protein